MSVDQKVAWNYKVNNKRPKPKRAYLPKRLGGGTHL